jgi:hypothetical protein
MAGSTKSTANVAMKRVRNAELNIAGRLDKRRLNIKPPDRFFTGGFDEPARPLSEAQNGYEL